MPWTSWASVLNPNSGNASIDAVVYPSGITYNYGLPYQNYINFSFDTSQASSATFDNTELSDLQKQCVRNALNYVNSVTGILFNELPNGSTQTQELVFVYSSNSGTDLGYGGRAREGVFTEYPTITTDASGNITALQIKNTIAFSNEPYMNNLQSGSQGYQALLQGIGQALGLRVLSPSSTPEGINNDGNTLMACYFSGSSYTAFQPLDIRALNWLYGGDGLLGTYGLTVDASGSPKPGGFNPAIGGASASMAAGFSGLSASGLKQEGIFAQS